MHFVKYNRFRFTYKSIKIKAKYNNHNMEEHPVATLWLKAYDSKT